MEEIIRKAEEKDVPVLKALWNECFPEDTEYADFFFENIFRLPSARVCVINGEVCAMIHVFPRKVKTPEGVLDAKYIYGVGTTKASRGRGIAGRMLSSEACDCDVLLLIPQSESLFAFYEKCGFCELAKVKKEVVSPCGGIEMKDATQEDIPFLNEVYEASLQGAAYAERDCATWKLLMSEYEFFGGGFKVFRGGYCAYYEQEGKLFVAEFFSDGVKASLVAGGFGRECTVITSGGKTPLAVMRPVSERAGEILEKTENRYINLMHN